MAFIGITSSHDGRLCLEDVGSIRKVMGRELGLSFMKSLDMDTKNLSSSASSLIVGSSGSWTWVFETVEQIAELMQTAGVSVALSKRGLS